MAKSSLWRKDNEIDWNEYDDVTLLDFVNKASNTPEIEVELNDGTIKPLKNTAAFQDYYKTPFDYNQLTYELKRRGYEQRWVKKDENVFSNKTNEVDNINNEFELDSFILKGVKNKDKFKYVKIPMFNGTMELIDSVFGQLKKGVKGVVIAQVIDELLRDKFNRRD